MAAVTICSDFGAQENNSVTVSIVSLSICHEALFPHLFAMRQWDGMLWSSFFWMLSFKPCFLLLALYLPLKIPHTYQALNWRFGSFFIPIILIAVCSVTQLCLTLWDSKDCSLPGSAVHGIFQARMVEWVAFPTPRDLPDPGIKPSSFESPVLAGSTLSLMPPGKNSMVLSSPQLLSLPRGLHHPQPP